MGMSVFFAAVVTGVLFSIASGHNQLKISTGLKMKLTIRNASCSGNAHDDHMLNRVSCMVKKSSLRANKMARALGTGHHDSMVIENPAVGSDYDSPLASGGGDYVTTVTVGTPPQTYSVIADTGSDLIWIQCKPCQACFKQDDPVFDPEQSSTYQELTCGNSMCKALPRRSCVSQTCEYTYGYGDGSGTRGTLSTETVTLTTTDGDTVKVKGVVFGCGHLNQGKYNDASGLIGLGRGDLSFVSQLGTVFDHKFSYCLVPWLDAPSKTSTMFFGDVALKTSGRMKYTKMVHNPKIPTFYYVSLKDVSIGGRALNIPKGSFDLKSDGTGGIIFDSGTTLTLIQDDAYKKIVDALKSRLSFPTVDGSSLGLDLCYDISGVKSYKQQIPSVVFHFDGADFELPVENYFIQVDNAGTYICLAMASSNMDIGIFGNLMQQNFHVAYDNESEKIGWAPSQCEHQA